MLWVIVRVIFHYNHQSVTCVLIQHVSNAHKSTVARHLTHQGSSNSFVSAVFRGARPSERAASLAPLLYPRPVLPTLL